MLRKQQEELMQNQERLEQERQQLLLQQQQQHMGPPVSQQPDLAYEPAHDSLQFETVTSKVRGGSPAHTSTVVAGPRRSEGRPQVSRAYPDQTQNIGSYSDRNQNGYGIRKSEPSWNNSRPQNQTWRGSSQSVPASQSGLPKWPPASSDQGRVSGASAQPGGPGQYSREDMMVMNRKATPLQSKPPTNVPVDQPEAPNPVRREAPSKGQIHSLNSVPKAKFRSSSQWIGEDDPSRYPDYSSSGGESRSQPAPSRRSEAYRNQFTGPQDHWLVQEAERRRMNESSYAHGPNRAQFSGPIKPASDSYGNHWREEGGDVRRSPNMPAQIRQTLLQKTAGARGSPASSSSQEINPQEPSPTYQSSTGPGLSQTLPPNYSYGGGYSPSSRSGPMPPQHRAPSPDSGHENGVGISGKHHCSHCNKELGEYRHLMFVALL